MAKDRSWKYVLLLTFTALIWGVAFVAQSEGSAYMRSSTFMGIRFLIAAATLLPVICVGRRRRARAAGSAREATDRATQRMARRKLWRAGIICGVFLGAASLLQQEAIAQGAGAGKAGFITATYIVIVPILNRLVFRKKAATATWIGVAAALAGLYLLCMKEVSMSLETSDILLILCAFGYSLQILAIDRFAPDCDAVELSAIQFLACGTMGIVLMPFADIAPVGLAAWAAPMASWRAWLPLLYAAILSSAVGYTLQIVGQKALNPTLASLLMSLESVFAALAGWVLLRQGLSPRELTGCALVFAAVILAQLPGRKHGNSV